jgi:hypothetical protein
MYELGDHGVIEQAGGVAAEKPGAGVSGLSRARRVAALAFAHAAAPVCSESGPGSGRSGIRKAIRLPRSGKL